VELNEWGYLSTDSYRYGFNGKELDKDGMGGGGSTYDYGFRIYNPALGKFLSVHPLSPEYPWYTPYQSAGNSIIGCIDIDGLEPFRVRANTKNTTQLNKAKSSGTGNSWRSRKFERRSKNRDNRAGTGQPEIEVVNFISGNGYQPFLDADGPYRKTFTKWIVYDLEGDWETVNYDMDGDGKPDEVYYSEKYKKKIEGFQFPPPIPGEETYMDSELEDACERFEYGWSQAGDSRLIDIFFSRFFVKWLDSKPYTASQLQLANCRRMAVTINANIGGKFLYIAASTGGFLRAILPNCEAVDSWFYYVAVVVGNWVYDSITGPQGMEIEEHKRVFTQEAHDGPDSIEFKMYDSIDKVPK
jgi:RHS repeat-associated protein